MLRNNQFFTLYTDVQKTTLRSKTIQHRAAKVDICVKTCKASLPEFQWGYIIIQEHDQFTPSDYDVSKLYETSKFRSTEYKTPAELNNKHPPYFHEENALKCLPKHKNRSIYHFFFFVANCTHVRTCRFIFSRNDIFVAGCPGRFSLGWRRVKRARQSTW